MPISMSPNYLGDQSSKCPTLAQLRREFVLNPITALAFFTSPSNGRQYLLAGEDNHIKVYDVALMRCCGELEVFVAQSIHGIAVPSKDAADQQILVWGGPSVAVLQPNVYDALISGKAGDSSRQGRPVEAKAPDWIFDMVLSPYESGRMLLLSAHNEVVEAQFNTQKCEIQFEQAVSPSRPNLYSGRLSWESQHHVLVAAGTVFGEILVWKYHLGSNGEEPSCEVVHVFSGHEGSIFGVHISPTIQLEGGKSRRLLASCSDDRTIRVWDITEDEVSRFLEKAYEAKISAARETGFGDSVEELTSERNSTRCVATVMGHVSRIWQVEFPQLQPTAKESREIELWSFGEDATAQQWALSLGDNLLPHDGVERGSLVPVPTMTAGQLKHQNTFSNHSGKQIWSHALTHSTAGHLLVATGGADGKISLIQNSPGDQVRMDLSGVALPPNAAVSNNSPSAPPSGENSTDTDLEIGTAEESKLTNASADFKEKPKGAVKKSKKRKVKVTKEVIQQYCLITKDRLLAVTNLGRVLVGASKVDSLWKELSLPHNSIAAFVSYSVVKSSKAGSVAFVGTGSGEVFIYCDDCPAAVQPLTKVHGKVADMFSLSEDGTHRTWHGRLEGSSRTIGGGTQLNSVLLLVTVLGSSQAFILHVDTSSSIVDATKTEVTLPVGFIVTSAALCRDFLVLGSRNGMLSVLRISADGVYSPISSIRAKIDDAVTSVLSLPRKESTSSASFLTTHRDGKYRIYSISGFDDHIEPVLHHETSPPFGPIIEGAWFSNNQDGSRDLMLCGFRSKNFVVWNETQRREIVTVECGGAHRNFTYAIPTGHPDGFGLVYTKVSQLQAFRQTHAPHKAIKSGGHGREIRAISYSGNYVATAAEDTAIRIWSYDGHAKDADRKLDCLAVMEKHTAGIQTLKWHGQNYLFSSGGNEEFFVWKVSRLQSSYAGLAVVCEAVFPDRSEIGDLRIMNFDVHCLEEAPAVLRISMALSNSTLQTYTYSRTNGFRLVARGAYTGACLTQLRHLETKGASLRALTAATDGHIAVWEAASSSSDKETQPGEYKSVLVTKLHQNAIKSLDMHRLETESGISYLVVSGGDDNALGVTHLHRNKATGRFTIRAKAIVRSAHAAAITGLVVLKSTRDGKEVTVVSSSNDQRVKTWRLADWQTGTMRVLLSDDQYSSVADSGDLEVLDGGRVMVGGVGLEIWTVDG